MKRAGEKPSVELYADGACSGNPGVGGYGVILRSGERERVLSGSDPQTTNNRMELTAVMKGLEALRKPCSVTVFTDSNYVVQGMTSWIERWRKSGWKNSQKQEVANRDLWEKLLHLSANHDIRWIWVKGHSEHPENERCDKIAREEIRKRKAMSCPRNS